MWVIVSSTSANNSLVTCANLRQKTLVLPMTVTLENRAIMTTPTSMPTATKQNNRIGYLPAQQIVRKTWMPWWCGVCKTCWKSRHSTCENTDMQCSWVYCWSLICVPSTVICTLWSAYFFSKMFWYKRATIIAYKDPQRIQKYFLYCSFFFSISTCFSDILL